MKINNLSNLDKALFLVLIGKYSCENEKIITILLSEDNYINNSSDIDKYCKEYDSDTYELCDGNYRYHKYFRITEFEDFFLH